MRSDIDLSLYLILGPTHGGRNQGISNLAMLARDAVAGGVTLVQYRDKSSDTGSLIDAVRTIKAALRDTGVPVLVNDRVDIAQASDADGVHLGQDDMTPHDARRILGPDKMIGLTVKNPEHANAVDRRFLNYVSVGGVFETTSKQNPDPPIGIDGLRDMNAILTATAPGLPRCAIAGISSEHIEDVIAAGSDGICVIRAITEADDPRGAAQVLRAAVDEARARNERQFA